MGRIRNFRVIRSDPFVDGPIEDVIISTAGGGGGFGATGPTGSTGPTGADGTSGGGLLPPVIAGIEGSTGTVFFENPSGLQIEVWKYTRRRRSTHAAAALPSAPAQPYSDRKGKRFKPLRLLANGALSYVVEDRWINPIVKVGAKRDYRNYFRFGVRDPATGDRSPLTSTVVATAVNFEFAAPGISGLRIFIHPHLV